MISEHASPLGILGGVDSGGQNVYQKAADEFPDVRFTVEDQLVAEADRPITECPQDEEDLIRLYDADPAKITIIPCGVDPMRETSWP